MTPDPSELDAATNTAFEFESTRVAGDAQRPVRVI